MESIFAVYGSVPIILALALFVGVVILVRILLSPDGALERRRTSRDRRQLQSMPPLPFYDSERTLVTRDRRSADRRKRRFVIMSTQRRA